MNKKILKKSVNGKNGLTYLSIDPGCRHTGWSISTMTPSGKLRVINHGVFEHNYSPEENATFFKSILASNFVVLIEDPPIIRTNASTSHVLGKIFGCILGVISTSNVMACVKIAPRVWQHSLLHDQYALAKKDGFPLTAKQKDLLIKAVVNKNITRKKDILNVHVLDTIGMVLYYCKRNGHTIESVNLIDALKTTKPKRKYTRRKVSDIEIQEIIDDLQNTDQSSCI